MYGRRNNGIVRAADPIVTHSAEIKGIQHELNLITAMYLN